MKIGGVYQIKNIVNGKFYIGSSIDVHLRWKSHVDFLNRGNHANIYLQNSWNKYGQNNFEFSILVVCDDVLLTEQMYLDANVSDFNCYNIKNVAVGFSVGSDNPNWVDGNYGKIMCSCGKLIDKKSKSCRLCWLSNNNQSDYIKKKIVQSRVQNCNRIYHTPWGDYKTPHQAIKNCSTPSLVFYKSLRRWCEHSDEIISNFSFGNAKYLKHHYTRNQVVGQTWESLGFYLSNS